MRTDRNNTNEGLTVSIFRHYCTQAVSGMLLATTLALMPASAVWAKLEPSEDGNAISARSDHKFPLPDSLVPAVDFWTKVFADWRRDQVALHDNEHLGVVYRVVDIPGDVAEGLTLNQRAWVRSQEERLVAELSRLAKKHAAGQALTKDEQHLAQAIKRGGGTFKGAAERVRTQRGTRERFLRGMEISGRYDRAFRAIFRSHGLPEDLAYLPHVESSFQIGARSSVGAAGMWQFMPSTARSYMTVNSVVDERLNPLAAADGAARYFAGAYRTLGSWPLAVTSYNHGIGSMNRAKARYGHDFARIVREYDAPSFGFSSRNFYAEFLAVRRIAQSPHKYFPEGVNSQAPLAVRPVVLKRSLHAHEVSMQAGTKLTTLAELNPGWSERALKGRSRLPAGVTVWVPSGKYVPELNTPTATGSTQVAKNSGAKALTHRVKAGDSLWSIARRHDTTVAKLSAHNGLDAGNPHLKIGQVLALPSTGSTTKTARARSTTATTHRVTAGDTPFDIATTYRVSLRNLLAANNMDKRSVIRPGQQLLIPAAD
ncbi:MAG TPA: LysM peptidoglycan-binding domain-containing protein [Gammaproteobacteria bacterium]